METLIKEFQIASINGIEGAKPSPNSPYEAIIRSIKKHGVLSPVVIHKESKTLIAGKSRCLACIKLNLPTIPAWLVDDEPDSPEAQFLAIQSDFEHKWYSELEENVLLAKQKQFYLLLYPETAKGTAGAHASHGSTNEMISFAKYAADLFKVSEKTIQNKVKIGEKLSPAVSTELELPAAKFKAKKFANNQSEQLALIKHPADYQVKIIKRYLGTDDSQLPKHQPIKFIAHAIQSLNQEANIGKYGVLPDEQFPIVCGDFTKPEMIGRIKDRSVALIATDMPYGKKYLHLIEPIFRYYSSKLTDEGHIAIMYGQDSEPAFWETVIPLIKTYGLRYRGQMITVTPPGGNGSCENAGLMIHHYKPIAVFAKPHKYRHAVNDTIQGNGVNEKTYYEWEQKISDFETLIKRLSEPTDLVIDLMAGSGTTGIAAMKTGRRFLGFEIHKAVYEIAKTHFVDERKKAGHQAKAA